MTQDVEQIEQWKRGAVINFATRNNYVVLTPEERTYVAKYTKGDSRPEMLP